MKTRPPNYERVTPTSADLYRETEEHPGISRRTLVRGTGVVLGVLVAAAVVLGSLYAGPAVSRSREDRLKRESLGHVEGITMALMAYAQNHDGRYPATGKDWEYLLANEGFIRMGVFRAPGSSDDIDGYFFVPGGEQKFDAKRVIVYENPALWKSGGGHAGFDDGQVKWFDKAEYEALLASITFPPGERAPHLRDVQNPAGPAR